MLPYRVSNHGPLTYESGALPIALHGPAVLLCKYAIQPRTRCVHFQAFSLQEKG